MSALRPHIRAARAYEQAYTEGAAALPTGHPRRIELYDHAVAHRRAAEIMEAEQAAEYQEGATIP